DHRDLHSFPTRRSSDLPTFGRLLSEALSPQQAVIRQVPLSSAKRLDCARLAGALAPPGTFACLPPKSGSKLHALQTLRAFQKARSEEHTSELQSRGHLV